MTAPKPPPINEVRGGVTCCKMRKICRDVVGATIARPYSVNEKSVSQTGLLRHFATGSADDP